MNERKERLSWLVLTFIGGTCLLGCASQGPSGTPAAKNAKAKAEVFIGPAAMREGDLGVAAWISYGVGRVKRLEERSPSAFNQGGDDYDVELAGWRAMLLFYKDSLGKEDATKFPVFLKDVARVDAQGYLREYVIYFFAQPGWTVPATELKTLDFPGFAAWANTELRGHQPHRDVVTAGPSGERVAKVPGASLPRSKQIGPAQNACGSLGKPHEAALAQWLAEVARIPGRPLVASNAEHFANLLNMLKSVSIYQERGATWVDANVVPLVFNAGFCAIELKQFALAVRYLKAGVEAAPFAFGMRLELAHAMSAIGQNDQALAQVDAVLRTADGACTLARALRKKGFILIDQGDLQLAHAAYVESLKHEPGNRIALSELKVIEDQANAPYSANKIGAYTPPPQGEQVTTTCRE